MQKEMKIGIFATLIIGLSAWGFQFLKGNSLFDNSLHLKTTFSSAQQLQVGSLVRHKGVEVGQVTHIDFGNDGQILVSFSVKNRNIEIPKSAIAELHTQGIIQRSSVIDLLFENACYGRDCAENGDILRGRDRSLWNNLVETVVSGVTALDTLGKEFEQELKQKYQIDLDALKKEAKDAMEKGAKNFEKQIKTNNLNIKISIDSNGISWQKK